MSKILIELKKTDLQNDQNHYYEAQSLDSIGYRKPEDIFNTELKRNKFHERSVVDNKVLRQNDHVGINDLLSSGYIISNESYLEAKVRLRKETRYCMTKDTLDIVNDLFIEDKKKYESRIYDLVQRKKEIGQSFDKFVDMIDTAGFFKRLKYLFTGWIE